MILFALWGLSRVLTLFANIGLALLCVLVTLLLNNECLWNAFVQPLLLRLDPETAHRIAVFTLRRFYVPEVIK